MIRKLAAFFLFSLVMVACQSAPAQPALQTGVHLQAEFLVPDELEGEPAQHDKMNYLIYLPDGYGEDSSKQWPLILFLHGAGSDTNDSQFVMSYGLPEVLLAGDQPEQFPFVVVSPQAFPGLAWWDEETLLVLDELLEEIITTYSIDPRRVYVTGLSMGGYGTWFIATAFPERFAAAVSVSGSGYRTNRVPDPAYLCRMRDIPFWAIHGAEDRISAPEVSKMFAERLADCGGEVKWTLYPDDGHMGAYTRAYRDPEVYAWMLSHSLEDRQ